MKFLTILISAFLVYWFIIGPPEKEPAHQTQLKETTYLPTELQPGAAADGFFSGSWVWPLCALVVIFLIIVRNPFTKSSEVMGAKKSRRGALNFLFGFFKENDVKITQAHRGRDALGDYDYFEGSDARGRNREWHIEDTNQYPTDPPDFDNIPK